jgi:peptidoglycan L-alanyl-D-glutamate endopeptidase CwlK
MLQALQNTFSANLSALINAIHVSGMTCSMGECYRTSEQQEIYIKQGKSKTNNSMHCLRLAVDINIFINGQLIAEAEKLAALGKYWRDLHPQNRWGGDWNKNGNTKDEKFVDFFHFEMQPN